MPCLKWMGVGPSSSSRVSKKHEWDVDENNEELHGNSREGEGGRGGGGGGEGGRGGGRGGGGEGKRSRGDGTTEVICSEKEVILLKKDGKEIRKDGQKQDGEKSIRTNANIGEMSVGGGRKGMIRDKEQENMEPGRGTSSEVLLTQNSSRSSSEGGANHRNTNNNSAVSSLCGLLSTLAERLSCGKSKKKKRQRGEGVTLGNTAQNGLLVRMLGDIKGSTTVETSLTPSSVTGSSDIIRRRSSDGRRSITGGLATSTTASSSALHFPPFGGVAEMGSVGDAEERLLRGVNRGTGTYSRFLTLHRRRKRKPPTHAMDRHHRALVDDLYHGPTECLLSQVQNWDFNAFALDTVCGGRPVSVLCVYLLHKYGLVQHYNLDTVNIWKCFTLIEEGYHASNPYHNAIHAADVTQAMHCYLQEERIKEHMTPIETLAALVAAVCHDLDHPGVNQPFLIATDNHLAALYKNLSVLENHHWRCAMGCLWESGMLDSWKPEDVNTLQDMIRSLILATDITRQQEFLSRFQKYLNKGSLNMRNPEHRHFSLQIALKCADICNPCRPWDISRKWSHKICDEFYRQGDYEKKLNLPVTSSCDRNCTTVANIQIGFIKFVVSPLFDAWNSWLNSSLSIAMVDNMNFNLSEWECELKEEKILKASKDVESTTALEKPLKVNVHTEEEEEDVDEMEGGTTPSSSADSHQSVLGSLENVSRSLQLGRRHSVPLNFPGMIPRTIMRRESLPEEGSQPVVLETVVIGEGSLVSIRPHRTDSSDNLTADALLPDPSITAMGGVDIGSARLSEYETSGTRLARRMSLPLMAHHYRSGRHLHKHKPLSHKPSEDVTQKKDSEDATKDNKPRTEPIGSSARGTVTESGSRSVYHTSGGSYNSGSDCGDTLGSKTHRSTKSDSVNTVRDCGVHSKNPLQNVQGSGATFLHTDSIEKSCYRSRSGKVLVRRASLDSSSSSSKREFLDRLSHEGNNKFARIERTDLERDKENLIPRELPPGNRERPIPPLWKTRAWRSLNYEDDKGCDIREKFKPGIYKLNQTQGSMYAHGRRGSAPLLKPEELWGGLRGGAERPDYRYLSTRRGSAPSQQIHHGLEDECGNEENFAPLTSTENLPVCDNSFIQARLRGRRNSMPFEVLGLDNHDPLNIKEQTEVHRYARRGSGGLDMGPTLVSRARPSLSTNYGGSGLSGGGSGGATVHSSMSYRHRDSFRGSGSLEILSLLWRSHYENGNSFQHDDVDMCSQSSGGMTPSTPGPLPAPRRTSPFTLHRRGSLPTDLFYSGDLSVWGSEGT